MDNKAWDKKNNVLDVAVKNYTECGFCGEQKNTVFLSIPWEIWCKWQFISQKMQDKEWGGVFWAQEDTITKFKLPKQEVTSTECSFKEELGGDGIVHSHHNMEAFHSAQDDAAARNLYAYSIVLSNSKGYEATKRIKLPCGGFGYIKIELRITDCPEIDITKISTKEHALQNAMAITQRPGEEGIRCYECQAHACDTCENFELSEIPCFICETLKCKTCKGMAGMGNFDMPPFCSSCEDCMDCSGCGKLDLYVSNYPKEKQRLKTLLMKA